MEDKGWVNAEDLQGDDDIRQADGSTGEVEVIEIEEISQEMYNLTVDEAHTFFVGDGQWLVHNANCDPQIWNKINQFDTIPGFNRNESNYIKRVLTIEDSRASEVLESWCHVASLCGTGRFGGVDMLDVAGHLDANPSFVLQGRFGVDINITQLDPGDLLTFSHTGSDTIAHSSRVLFGGQNPIMFNKQARGPFVFQAIPLDQVISDLIYGVSPQINGIGGMPQTILTYRRFTP